MIQEFQHDQLREYLTQIIGLSMKDNLPTINQKTVEDKLMVSQSLVSKFINATSPKSSKMLNNFSSKYPDEFKSWPHGKATIERILNVADALYFLGIQPKLIISIPKTPIRLRIINPKSNTPTTIFSLTQELSKDKSCTSIATSNKFTISPFIPQNGLEIIPFQEPWFIQITTGNGQPHHFPYHYASTLSKTIRLLNTIFPDVQGKFSPKFQTKSLTEPVYILNIPFLARESLSMHENAEKINALIKKISEQSFFNPNKSVKSNEIAANKVIVILGINRPYSIDSSKNDEFISWIKNFPKINEIQTFVMGTLWHPKMQHSNGHKITPKDEETKEKEALEFFQKLKIIDPQKAAEVQQFLNNQKFIKNQNETKKTRIVAQTPFQQIRNWILNEMFSQEGFKVLFNLNMASPIYLGIMDGDTDSLNGHAANQVGLLAHYDNVVLNKIHPPMLMSSGYYFPTGIDPTSQLANYIDMNIRTKMASILSLGVYFPEPNLFLLLNDLLPLNQNKISFIGGTGNDTESRRLIENLNGLWDLERIHMISTPCMITTPPKRMIATQVGDFPHGFTVYDLSNKLFKSLRGISQTHFMPKIWASNMAVGLTSSGAIKNKVSKIYKLHSPLSKICSAFDFPAFFKIMNFEDSLKKGQIPNFSSYKLFNRELILYSSTIVRNESSTLEIPISNYSDYFNSILEQLKADCQMLANLGISEEFQEKVLYAAATSGEAVYDTLACNVEGF